MADLKSELTRVDAARMVQPAKPRGILRLDRSPSWERRPKGAAPPPSFFVREFTMGDGRRITIDKRAVAFVCEGNAGAEGKPATIVAFRAAGAKPVPVRESYDDVKSWWLATEVRSNDH
jgi:hypothetical protein